MCVLFIYHNIYKTILSFHCIMPNVYEHDKEYLYPPGPVFRPYVVTLYYMTHDFKNKMLHVFLKKWKC